MALSEQEVKKVARLARIGLSDDVGKFTLELANILELFNQLNEVDTSKVSISNNQLALPMRTDKVTDGNIVTDILANAPAQEFNCFVVPKVIE
jgi:aspartyl-tRNA(Asn)/glutamyl-tRNA(Gln) amidotransferase subunit C